MTAGKVSLLDLSVVDAMELAHTLTLQDDLLTAVDNLRQRGVYAVIVVQDEMPVGILTGKDMSVLFHNLFEGILLVERIETRLTEFMRTAFPEPAVLNEAAIRAFGPGPKNPQYAARHPDRFTFGDLMLFMCDDDIWPAFEAVLGSREVFMQLMDRTRRVRNALMHFRGNLSPSEQDALRKAYLWLSQRPMPALAPPLPPFENYGSARTTGNNPYVKVMGRKPRTLPAGDSEQPDGD